MIEGLFQSKIGLKSCKHYYDFAVIETECDFLECISVKSIMLKRHYDSDTFNGIEKVEYLLWQKGQIL
jgi:hypothetical protein